MKVFLLGLVLAFASGASASGGNRVLALLDNLSIKESHSIFFKNIQDLGLDVTFKVADDPSIILKKYGSFLYDHLIIFSPTVEEFGGALSVEGVTEFVDNGGNVLIAGNSNTGDILREIARYTFLQSLSLKRLCLKGLGSNLGLPQIKPHPDGPRPKSFEGYFESSTTRWPCLA